MRRKGHAQVLTVVGTDTAASNFLREAWVHGDEWEIVTAFPLVGPVPGSPSPTDTEFVYVLARIRS